MKIAFIAMSGIRACDQELLALGLTLPGFVERSKTIASLPSLGLLTLAGMTPKHHEISYHEIDDITHPPHLPMDADLVAISSFSAQIFEAYALCAKCKEWGIPTVMGGLHVTSLPEEALQHCDAVVVGEGEPVWQRVLDDAEKGSLSGIYGSKRGDFDLANAPLPAYELLDISKYNRLTVQTSRGCPHRCDFCASSVLLTPQYKQKPIGKVLEELDAIHRIWSTPFIEFADDNSFVDKAYWKSLLQEIERRPFRWFAESDISVSEDEALLTQMRRSGCAQVLIGLESPTEETLQGLELKRDWKRKKHHEYRDAIRRIQSKGIAVNGCFIIGLDHHTPEIFRDVFEYARELELFEVQVTVSTAFPGTPLHHRLMKEDRIIEPGRWDKCTLFDVNFHPNRMSAEELTQGFRGLIQQMYSSEATNWRKETFKEYLRLAHASGSL